MEPRKVVLHQSLTRPMLLGGAERARALANGVVVLAMVFGVGSWQAAVIGIALGLLVQAGLVRLAKADTQFFDVYRRHINYQDYYPAQTPYSAPVALVREWKV